MNELALDLTIKCFETQDPYLDLGRCSLTDEDFIAGSPLDKALRKCTHLKHLVLSNTWYEWDEGTKGLKINTSQNLLEQNYFTIYPLALEELDNLTILACGGESPNYFWQISNMSFVKKLHRLTHLDLSYNQIEELEGLEKLTGLQTFNISGNYITELKGLHVLTGLREFNISHNQITELKGLESLVALTTLNLSANQISEIKGLESLVALTTLNLSANQISEIKGLESLAALTALYLSTNRITEVKGLKNMSSLTTLFLTANKIIEIKGFENPVALTTLNLSTNQISEIKGLENLAALTKLDLSNNQISEIKGLENLVALTTLYLSRNQIVEVKGFEKLIALSTLYLSNNQIIEIKGLKKLIALSTLYLSNNQIIEIKEFEKLISLSALYLSNNKISEIKGLESLVALTTLDLSYNKIGQIKGLEKLVILKMLNLSSNQISEIKGLDFLFALQRFDISDNKISDITPLLLPFLQREYSPLQVVVKVAYELKEGEINVRDNPLSIPPMEIVQQGNDAVFYWCAAQDQGKVVNRETKIILFGNGRSGKTTLSLRLRKNKFVPLTEKDRTHGILIETWDIPQKDLPEKLKQRIAENIYENDIKSPLAIMTPASFQIHLWDFGGQEYYHATHRLFMSNNILYLLVWEKETDYQDEEKGEYPRAYWQKNINHFSQQNITICVQNKVKKQADRTDNLHYKIEWRNENDERTINRYENDIEDLKEGILEHLADLSYIGELFPRVYDDIRQALQKIESPYISFADYKKLCKANDNTPSRIMQDDGQKETLIRFLDDTGALVCFRFRKGIKTSMLKEYVFTNPVWLTEIIYKILAKKKDEEKGEPEFDREHVEQIVFNDGLDAMSWIEIMKQFELIFEIEKDGIKYVVPQYLSSVCTEPATLRRTLRGRNIKHVFTLCYPEFLPKSNFLRLLAKYGKENLDFIYWQKGLLFFLNEKVVFAKCINDPNERKIVIETEDRDAIATKEIFETLIAMDEADDLQVSVNKKDFVEVKKLKEKIYKNNTEIDSVEGNTLQVNDFNILFEMKKEEFKTRKVFISYAHDDISFKEELQSFLINIEREGLINIWQDELITAGENWDKKIKEAMEKADICILLLSQSLISSSYSHEIEFKTIMEKRAAGTALIIPVLIKDCDWKNWKVYPDKVANKLTEDEIKNYSIGTFQFLPINDKKRVHPLNQWRFKEKAWKQVGDAIRKFCADNAPIYL